MSAMCFGVGAVQVGVMPPFGQREVFHVAPCCTEVSFLWGFYLRDHGMGEPLLSVYCLAVPSFGFDGVGDGVVFSPASVYAV